jgi:hypothetical protein
MNLKSPSGCNVTMKATRLGHTLIFYFILILKNMLKISVTFRGARSVLSVFTDWIASAM